MLPPKFVTVLYVVQSFVVLAGSLVTRAALKIWETQVPGVDVAFAPHIPAFVQVIRVSGLWLLLVPAAWCIVATLRAKVTNGSPSITLPHFIFGLMLTVALGLAFALSAVYAMHAAYGATGSSPFHR